MFCWSASWFVGQCVSVFAVLFLSIVLGIFTKSVLYKATVLYLGVMALLLVRSEVFSVRSIAKLFGHILQKNMIGAFLAVLCFSLFSFFLFSPHLATSGGTIYTSPTYWDFNIHFPIIQTLVWGDNILPENESFAGLPMTYHYLYDFLNAMYASLGWELVGSLTLVAVLSFTCMLVMIVGVGEELLGSLLAGFIAVFLTLTNGSLRFLYTARLLSPNLFSAPHPYFYSLLPGNPFGYNGTMFNIYYFIAERQMIPAVMFILVSMVVLYYRRHVSPQWCCVLGILMGAFFQWHLFATITVFCAVFFMLLVARERRRTAWMIAGFSLPVLIQVFYFRLVLASGWFLPTVSEFPKFNMNFPTMEKEYTFSPVRAVLYYVFSYGAKLPVFLLSVWLLFRKNKPFLLVLLAVIVPTFVLVNTVQLSPLSVYDNHKWLRPMNVVMDIALGFVLAPLFLKKPRLLWTILAAVCLFFLTASGVIELIPFLQSRPTKAYGKYPSEFTNDVRAQTAPRSVFVSSVTKELHLAGRKVFVLNEEDEPGATSFLRSARFDMSRRKTIMKRLYRVDVQEFCDIVRAYGIDYVDAKPMVGMKKLRAALKPFPSFSTVRENAEPVTFIHASAGCRSPNAL